MKQPRNADEYAKMSDAELSQMAKRSDLPAKERAAALLEIEMRRVTDADLERYREVATREYAGLKRKPTPHTPQAYRKRVRQWRLIAGLGILAVTGGAYVLLKGGVPINKAEAWLMIIMGSSMSLAGFHSASFYQAGLTRMSKRR